MSNESHNFKERLKELREVVSVFSKIAFVPAAAPQQPQQMDPAQQQAMMQQQGQQPPMDPAQQQAMMQQQAAQQPQQMDPAQQQAMMQQGQPPQQEASAAQLMETLGQVSEMVEQLAHAVEGGQRGLAEVKAALTTIQRENMQLKLMVEALSKEVAKLDAAIEDSADQPPVMMGMPATA